MVRKSRAASRTGAAVAVITTVLAGSGASAHRLDEYLQAARIDIGEGRVEVELSLTPGAAVSGTIIEDIDRDRDGSLSASERGAYIARVLSAISLEADGRPVEVRAISSSFPEVDAVRRGEGSILFRAEGLLPPQSSGGHRLLFRNTYRADISVYLANAVEPASQRFGVTAQRRDPYQRELTIEYEVDAEPSRSWLAFVLIGIATVTLVTTRFMEVRGVRQVRDTTTRT